MKETDMAGKLIGEMAREFGVNPRTLRYYETLCLLPTPRRSRGGYRLYDEESERKLAFIARAKSLGLTLREIREIFTVAGGGAPPCNSVRQILSEHVRHIDQQMARLRALKSDLRAVVTRCRRTPQRNGSLSRQNVICPGIETLGNAQHGIRNGGGGR
jgi:DNA-binding transcriptional MerR regulator